MTVFILITALVVALAYVTRFDALGFPRTEDGGTKEEQRAFHRDELYPRQFGLFFGYAVLAWVTTGSILGALPWVLTFTILLVFAVHDVGYWLWRLWLKLNTWSDWNPLGTWRYWKRWNLGYRMHAALAGASPERPLTKRIDTVWRGVGLLLSPLPHLFL